MPHVHPLALVRKIYFFLRNCEISNLNIFCGLLSSSAQHWSSHMEQRCICMYCAQERCWSHDCKKRCSQMSVNNYQGSRIEVDFRCRCLCSFIASIGGSVVSADSQLWQCCACGTKSTGSWTALLPACMLPYRHHTSRITSNARTTAKTSTR